MQTKPFIHEDFLLDTEPARRLYHDYARNLPIIDYHCHLPPAEIAADRRYDTITALWLAGDHYKWRAMRTNGVAERFCTGRASDWQKFEQWARTVPWLLRNPLYAWTHLELTRYFGVNTLLGPGTAASIWETCNALLQKPEFSCRGLMRRSNVVLVCTTDDPVDDLEAHRRIAADADMAIQVLPAWRPDQGLAVDRPERFNAWIDRLEAAADVSVHSLDAFLEALERRHAFFHERGCRLSDHGLETVDADDCTPREAAAVFDRVRRGQQPEGADVRKFRSAMLYEFGRMDHARGWTQQYHLGCLRNANTRMYRELGPDTGFDAIGDFEIGRPLARLLDRLEQNGALTRTILYNLNPRDNALLVTLAGCFQDGVTPGKLQHGSAWWFLDHRDGIERQIDNLSQTGLLSRFVGMLTDSRSFLSFARHEYFRRILCNLLGRDMARGSIPNDLQQAGALVREVCYGNAARYFGFRVPRLEDLPEAD